MHILLTGASGRVGSATLLYLLEHGHRATTIDLIPLPERLSSQIPQEAASRVEHHVLNLCDYTALDAFFAKLDPVDGLIHLGAIPDPLSHDARQVHGDNVLGAYNIMKTAIDHGVKRITSASSVNATGFSYTPDQRQVHDVLPINEEAAMRAMDPYALSKQYVLYLTLADGSINEIQADSLNRIYGTRIASLRFHMVKPTYEDATPYSRWEDLWCWVSDRASARACLLGITSEGWEGHEVFCIVAPEICWEGGVSEMPAGTEDLKGKVSTLELIDRPGLWDGRIKEVKREWWDGKPRRSVFDTSKAERLLGWYHEEHQ